MRIIGPIEISREKLEGATTDPQVLDSRVAALQRTIAGKPPGKESPKRAAQTIVQFERLPAVKAWVLHNANGTCELCRRNAPFNTIGGIPFLEVHHIVPLSEGGPDTITNAVALCPNCHREVHLGEHRLEKTKELFHIERIKKTDSKEPTSG